MNRITTSSDITFDIWPVTLSTQVVQCLSIVTSCMVYLKPFLDSLETGFIQVGDMRRQNVPGFGFSPEQDSKSSRETKSAFNYSSLRTKLSKLQPQNEDLELQERARADLQYLGNSTIAGTEPHDWDQHSPSHILRTTTLTVQRDDSRDQVGNKVNI